MQIRNIRLNAIGKARPLKVELDDNSSRTTNKVQRDSSVNAFRPGVFSLTAACDEAPQDRRKRNKESARPDVRQGATRPGDAGRGAWLTRPRPYYPSAPFGGRVPPGFLSAQGCRASPRGTPDGPDA
jgi:hypothetical protein